MAWMSQDVFYDIDLEAPLGSASIAQARHCRMLHRISFLDVYVFI